MAFVRGVTAASIVPACSRNPSALLVGRRLQRAFSEPVIPARVGSLAGLAVAQPTTGPAAAPEGAAA